nr:hypothetical protein [Chroococcidiopsis thermalis]
MRAIGLVAQARTTARMAVGYPILRVISLYVTVVPMGMVCSACQTCS